MKYARYFGGSLLLVKQNVDKLISGDIGVGISIIKWVLGWQEQPVSSRVLGLENLHQNRRLQRTIISVVRCSGEVGLLIYQPGWGGSG